MSHSREWDAGHEGNAQGPQSAPRPPAADTVAPDIPGVVAAGTKVTVIKEGFQGTEGPITLPDGSVIFTETAASRITKVDLSNNVSTFLEGRVYVGTLQGVQVFSAEGRHMGLIPVSQRPQNLAFAGPDKKTLFIVGQGAAYKLQMLSQGFKGRAK